MCLCCATLAYAAASLGRTDSPETWPTFEDVSAAWGISFQHRSSPTTEKYLLETMGAGVSDSTVHAGLGDDSRAQLIEVRWPTGALQQVRDVPAGQHVVIREVRN